MSFYPLDWIWNGSAMVPFNLRAAERQFSPGARYRLEVREERSAATHAHEFAWLHDAWANLPERIADLYPSPEHLRKRALIEAGFYDEEIVDAGSNAAALRVASAFRRIDDFALVIVRGGFVILRRAKSQSRRAMDKKTFQASKSAIMDVVAGLVGVTPTQLTANRAA